MTTKFEVYDESGEALFCERASQPPMEGDVIIWEDREYVVCVRIWERDATNEMVLRIECRQEA